MDLDTLARRQFGVITRTQALAHLSPGAVRWRLDRGLWQAVHPGVYRTHTGPLDWWGRASAALLHCGDGAALARDSAAYVLGINERPPPMLQLDIPHHLKHTRPVGVRIRRRRGVLATTLRRGLAVTTPARTVIDLGDEPGASREDAIGVAARAVQRGKVSVRGLAEELASRRRHRHRRALELSLGIVADGAESVLEVGFVMGVLRAHGLPPMRMAVPDVAGGASIRRDFLEDRYGVGVELDGVLGHEGNRRRDNRRDRSTAARGGVTLRGIGWTSSSRPACWPWTCSRRCGVGGTPAGSRPVGPGAGSPSSSAVGRPDPLGPEIAVITAISGPTKRGGGPRRRRNGLVPDRAYPL